MAKLKWRFLEIFAISFGLMVLVTIRLPAGGP